MEFLKGLAKGIGFYFVVSMFIGIVGIILVIWFLSSAGNGGKYEEAAVIETELILQIIEDGNYDEFDRPDTEYTMISKISYNGESETKETVEVLDNDITDLIYEFTDATNFFDAEYEFIEVSSISGSIAIIYVDYLFTYEDGNSKEVRFEYSGNPTERDLEIIWKP